MQQKIGRYEVLSQLGKGGMGMVYLAQDTLLGRKVAIKTIRLTELADTQEADWLRDRLIKEARAAAALSHPGIIAVYDVLVEGETTCLVMEYVNGSSLADLVQSGQMASSEAHLKVLQAVASALDYAHGKGVVHRDIKPPNIMIDTLGSVKVADFGIAKLGTTQTTSTAGLAMGTLEFMAPEQIRGEQVDGRTDQFSLAAMSYGLLTGRKMFQADSFVTLAHKMLNETPAPPSQIKPGLNPAVDRVLLRGLSKEATQRYRTCGEFVHELQQAFQGTHLPLPPTREHAPPPMPPSRPPVLPVSQPSNSGLYGRQTATPPSPPPPPPLSAQPATTPMPWTAVTPGPPPPPLRTQPSGGGMPVVLKMALWIVLVLGGLFALLVIYFMINPVSDT